MPFRGQHASLTNLSFDIHIFDEIDVFKGALFVTADLDNKFDFSSIKNNIVVGGRLLEDRKRCVICFIAVQLSQDLKKTFTVLSRLFKYLLQFFRIIPISTRKLRRVRHF